MSLTTWLLRRSGNVLTVAVLLCGLWSMFLVSTRRVSLACVLILVAAVLDLFDGPLARKFAGANALGVQLDALADLVAFGVAPVVLAHAIWLQAEPAWTWLVLLPYPAAGLIRLARLASGEHDDDGYRGLTISMSGVTISLACLTSVATHGAESFWRLSIPALVVVLAPLMLVPLRYPSALDLYRRSRRVLWGAPLVLPALALYPLHTLTGLAMTYDLVPLVVGLKAFASAEKVDGRTEPSPWRET